MRLLLDTCAFLWLVDNPRRLSERVRATLQTGDHEVFLSVVSVWDIILKRQKYFLLRTNQRVDDFVDRQITILGLQELALTRLCLGYLDRLPPHHQDPFDRILICQALDAACTLVIPDLNIQRYPVPILW
ncbi:MAG: type II toxin-antitoxin system VapC family toxin [Verrucomicrobia bacterium]|nr:type II toxin-antitoxin system VapC family toxin [Verrucomicrobiota bacterium]